MERRWVFSVVLAVLMAVGVNALGDWKSALVRTAGGRVAQEAIGEAVEDFVQDGAFDAVVNAVRGRAGDAEQFANIGETASSAVEAAMTASDVASSLDRAMDVADAA